jgi:hypothetical protein
MPAGGEQISHAYRHTVPSLLPAKIVVPSFAKGTVCSRRGVSSDAPPGSHVRVPVCALHDPHPGEARGKILIDAASSSNRKSLPTMDDRA